jgi:hypothetical protein
MLDINYPPLLSYALVKFFVTIDLLQKSFKTIKSICVYLCPSVVKNPKLALLPEV